MDILEKNLSSLAYQHAVLLDILTEILDGNLDISRDDLSRIRARSMDHVRKTKAETSGLPAAGQEKSEPAEFVPWRPARRRPGTGYVKQIGPNTWEGRYSPVWPDGKKHSRNIYGKTEAECEAKLKELILTMKAEIAAERAKRKQ